MLSGVRWGQHWPYERLLWKPWAQQTYVPSPREVRVICSINNDSISNHNRWNIQSLICQLLSKHLTYNYRFNSQKSQISGIGSIDNSLYRGGTCATQNKLSWLQLSSKEKGFEPRDLAAEFGHMHSAALITVIYRGGVRGDTPTVPSLTPLYSLPGEIMYH